MSEATHDSGGEATNALMSEATGAFPAAARHGGALGEAAARYGGDVSEWLDLSTGINPAPPPLPVLSPEAFTRLPTREAEAAVEAAARGYCGAPEAAGIVLAPGSQILISLFPHLVSPGTAAVLEPTYGEHRAALEASGHRVRGLSAFEAASDAFDIVVVVNPNNPDGRLLPRSALLDLAGRQAARGGWLVVDEAFADIDPAESLGADAGRPGLLVHRSFGKVFGYAGLRLGFALGVPEMTARLAARLGPWAVSGPALAVGAALMGDPAVIANVRRTVLDQARRRDGALEGAGLRIAGRTALFALVRHPSAPALFEALCRRRILTRPFAAEPDRLRFGNPAGEAETARLRAALASALAGIGA